MSAKIDHGLSEYIFVEVMHLWIQNYCLFFQVTQLETDTSVHARHVGSGASRDTGGDVHVLLPRISVKVY